MQQIDEIVRRRLGLMALADPEELVSFRSLKGQLCRSQASADF
jgi:hypothetical protein